MKRSASVTTDRPANIADALLWRAAVAPRAAALHAPGRRAATFTDLASRITHVRERFAAWGIVPGDCVAVAISARAEMATACLALPAAATCVPLSATATPAAYAALLDRLQPKAVATEAGGEHPLGRAARERGIAEIALVPEPNGTAGSFTLSLHRAAPSLARGTLLSSDHAYVLATSGTTGRPKLIPCTHRALLQRGEAIGRWLRYTPADVGCHVSPMHLGQGLRSALLDLLLNGASVACLPQASIDALFMALDEFRPTVLIASFAFHRELLARVPELGSRARANDLRFVRSASGRLDTEAVDRLTDAFGAPVLIGLSSTEAGPIAQDPLPPRPRRRGSVGLPFINEAGILADDGASVTSHGRGEIVVRGPTVFEGYLDDPVLTAQSFVGHWFRTGDLGEIDGDGFVYVTGRRKEVINRGGEKISPLEIDAVLESLPGVREAATFGVHHPTLGEEVVAAVVRSEGTSVEVAALLQRAGEALGPTRVPRRFIFVDRLPRTDAGKLRRAELADMVENDLRCNLEPPPGPPLEPLHADTDLEIRLALLWSEILRREEVGRTDDFFLAGGDSLSGARLLARIDAVWGVALPMHTLFGEAATLAGMARTLGTALRAFNTHTAPTPVQRCGRDA